MTDGEIVLEDEIGYIEDLMTHFDLQPGHSIGDLIEALEEEEEALAGDDEPGDTEEDED